MSKHAHKIHFHSNISTFYHFRLLNRVTTISSYSDLLLLLPFPCLSSNINNFVINDNRNAQPDGLGDQNYRVNDDTVKYLCITVTLLP